MYGIKMMYLVDTYSTRKSPQVMSTDVIGRNRRGTFDDDVEYTVHTRGRTRSNDNLPSCNYIGFWFLGLCNNFAYVVMLSAAKDILDVEKNDDEEVNYATKTCRNDTSTRDCHTMSTGAVLLADIIPTLLIKISAPFFIQILPFGLRHLSVVLFQASSFVIVATSNTVASGLFGVILASFGSGLGEITYLSLASHFNVRVVAAWSSGTGGAGIIGSLVYAFFTDRTFLDLSPRTTLLLMLVIPVLFAYTYWKIIEMPRTVHQINICESSSYLVPQTNNYNQLQTQSNSDSDSEPELADSLITTTIESQVTKVGVIKIIIRFMVCLTLVYFGEYFINQGMLELLEYNCSTGLSLSHDGQYRWYQVIYQMGVFVSRSSSEFVYIPVAFIPVFSLLQCLNAIFVYINAVKLFVPHITIMFLLIFYEGLLGGGSYVTTFRAVHILVPEQYKEFAMGVTSIADAMGILIAGILAIPVHNYVCAL